MHTQSVLIAELLAYLLAARLVLRHLSGGVREVLFTVLNLGGLYLFFFQAGDGRSLPTYLAYLALALVFYAALRGCGQRPGWLPWLAFLTPIGFLILIRYLPASLYGGPHRPYGPFFLGISYLAFRTSYLVVEIRNGSVTPPGLMRYLGYCFFVPTMSVGPINPYARYQSSFAATPPELPPTRAAQRLIIGLVKYKFLGSLCFQVTYANFLLDDHYHPWIDLPIAMVFYYLFLYCNFSGFCDMAIGAAGLIGVPVAENFDNPFAARNVKDFWNRWHITLSTYMRDVVFAPLSKTLVRAFGPAHANHAIALTITIVFLLVGVWHGVGWNYLLFGAAHALGVVTNHYYTLALKKRLGREGFKAYNENPWIHAAAVTLTFAYCAASLMLFANTLPQIRQIFASLQ